jgi:uncharacterized membrane protein YqaE (UPF0057 family)
VDFVTANFLELRYCEVRILGILGTSALRSSTKFDQTIREIPLLGGAQRSPSEHHGRSGKRWAHLRRRGISVDLLRIIVAILLPPLGVFLQVGIGKQFWINILLTILGYIPGIVHAVWVIAKY